MVKRLRHRPLTPVTRVRFPHGSPLLVDSSPWGLVIQPVFITVRSHPFPSRTRKLSSPVPKILGGKLPGKIGLRRHLIAVPFQGAAIPYSSLAQSVEHAAVNRRVVCSSQTGGARIEPLSSDQRLYFRRRAFSSVGQSDRLITGWSRVRIPEGPPAGGQKAAGPS